MEVARAARVARVAALLGAVVAGCGGSGDETCAPAAGDGTLMLVVTGHDPAAVSIGGVASVQTAGGMFTVAAGPHTITAAPVTLPQSGITSQVFAGTVDHPTACVHMGATTVVNVTYALVPTSGLLWAGVSNTPDDSTMLGFGPAAVAATGMTTADVATNTGGSDGFTFDRDGNMWVLGGTTADPPVARYPASTFASGGDKLPDIVIDSPSFGSSIPGPKVLAFDAAGNLWVSVVAANKVVMFSAAQLRAGGSPIAMVERTGLTSPQGLAFDNNGNLWVAAHDDDAVVRIDASHLAASGTGVDLAITAQSPPPVVGKLPPPVSLAFDAGTTLWVNYDGTIAGIPFVDQVGTGAKTITPAIQITTDVATLPMGIAFDQEGGLWLAHAVNQFARFDAAQLMTTGAVVPARVITSEDVGAAAWFAIYPAPDFSPLHHKVP